MFGYLCALQPSAAQCAPEAKRLDVCSYDKICDVPRNDSEPRESVYLHNVGASVAINCPMPSYTKEEMTADVFRKEVLFTGSSVIMNNLTDDWPMHDLWTFESLKENYGDLEVSVGRIPYGYRFGREYHKEPLRNYVEYLEDMIENDQVKREIHDTPQYIFDAEILELPAFTNQSFNPAK